MKSLVSPSSRFGAGAALLACGAIIGSMLSGCGGGSAFAGPITPPNSNANRIAFSSNRDGNFEIYTMNPDGSDVKRVTNNAADDTKPAWSRDHSKIAFVSERDGNEEIYVVNVANGQASGNAQRVTNNAAVDRAPSWNPDGTELVFQSNRDAALEAARSAGPLYIVNVNTRTQRRLTQRPGFVDSNPAWSPRGDLIAFDSQQIGDFREGAPIHIYTIKANGEDVKQLTTNDFNKYKRPVWHPNGQSLIFGFSAGVGLSTINADGTNEMFNQAFAGFFEPAYSPDGSQIVCSGVFTDAAGNTSTDAEIVVFDTSNPSAAPKRLTINPADDLAPTWQ